MRIVFNKIINYIYTNKIWLISATAFSFLVPYNTGYGNLGNASLTFAILAVARKSKAALILVFILFTPTILYMPAGHAYGKINIGHVASLLQTNTPEAMEFIKLNFIGFILCFLAIIFLLVYIIKSWNSNPEKSQYLFLVAFILLNVNSYPKRFAIAAHMRFTEAKTEVEILKNGISIKDQFTILKKDIQYENILVIIGESVTREYMSVYGYPLNTTPWLKNTNGDFYTNAISPAPNTFLSLPRTLAKFDENKKEAANNIVNLSNKAGLDTYWVSNQGRIGEFDTPATIIAYHAKHKFFLNNGDYESAKNSDDFQMLPYINNIIRSKEKKVIFAHMIGSHPNPCDRLQSYPLNFNTGNKIIDCYLSSIKKLDSFIKKATEMLEQNGKPYVIFYFSDHGLTIDNSSNPVRHGNAYRENYDIPFFIIDNKSQKHRLIDGQFSNSAFLSKFSERIGIEYKTPSDGMRSLDNVVYNGSAFIDYKTLPNLKIIDGKM
ncbi:phosphoethanolamine transferase [Aquitalea sp. ASV15]|uniref:phosphoethanolamine transferase n=1 Tax=Aquitalea sp. ASV15 TaxID=2795104 RepID=UPI0018EDA698